MLFGDVGTAGDVCECWGLMGSTGLVSDILELGWRGYAHLFLCSLVDVLLSSYLHSIATFFVFDIYLLIRFVEP